MSTVKTVATAINYHFKNFAVGSEGQKKLAVLVEAGKLTADDITVTAADGDTPEKWKRNSVEVKASVPVIEIEGLTPEQNAHIQYLITKQLESKNKDHIDACSGEFVAWDVVLQAPPVQKGGNGAIKVTKEMLETVVGAIAEYMVEAGYKQGAIDFMSAAGLQKFSVAKCRGVKLPVLTTISGIIKQWEDLLQEQDAEIFEAVSPVTTLWKKNIDAILNPEQTVTEDLFAL